MLILSAVHLSVSYFRVQTLMYCWQHLHNTDAPDSISDAIEKEKAIPSVYIQRTDLYKIVDIAFISVIFHCFPFQ